MTWKRFPVIGTWIDGVRVAANGVPLIATEPPTPINRFEAAPVTVQDIALAAEPRPARVIEVLDGQLITQDGRYDIQQRNGMVVSDTQADVLKLVVVNRYQHSPPAVGLVHGFGLNQGAFASSVAHDSHNVIAVGVDDEHIVQAINRVVAGQGGLAVTSGRDAQFLPLPVAGLMSDLPIEEVAKSYQELDRRVKGLGSLLRAPFMALSFVALLVIPSLKLSDKGLFDVDRFNFTSIFPHDDDHSE